MDTLEKLKILGAAAKYDVCAAAGSCGTGRGGLNPPRAGVCHSFTPDGRCISLFRVLMTNACQKDCFYCPNRAQRDIPRTGFHPAELARLFMEFFRRNYVAGLFLSSGVAVSPERTMEDMLRTVELLRLHYKYRGYIHLKILPGLGYDYIEQAARLASRVSVNIEAPNPLRMSKLSRLKDFQQDIIQRMLWVNRLQGQNRLPAGHTTQFIVGAAGESDAEILDTATGLYRLAGLRRAYFSAFQPVPDTPLENVVPAPLLREHRLYQTDFLLRQYKFSLKELAFDKEGNLPMNIDPKMAAALKNFHRFPLEINNASYEDLLRVPGIGTISASRIVKARRRFRISGIDELKNIGIVVKRAAPFILVNGKTQSDFKPYEQLALWRDLNDSFVLGNPPFSNQGGPFVTSL
ncbi:MAG: putative DNA modification/repair radical SAM protein [Bacillota bacterium]